MINPSLPPMVGPHVPAHATAPALPPVPAVTDPLDSCGPAAPVSSFGPVPAVRVASKAPAQSDPPLRATLYRKRDDGAFTRIQKYTTGNDYQKPVEVPGSSDRIFTATGPHGPVLVRVDARGDAQFSVPVDVNPNHHVAVPAADGSRIYVMDRNAGFVYDGATGEQIRRLPLPASGRNWALEVMPSGEVLLAAGQELQRFDPDLNPLASTILDFSPTSVRVLPDGNTLLHDSLQGRDVQVLGAGGEILMRRGDQATRVGQPQVGPDGTVWVTETCDSPPPGASRKSVTCHDPRTGSTRTFPTSDSATHVYPRKDGSYVVLEEPRATETSLVLYDREGREVRRFKPDGPGGCEQAVLSADGSAAFMLVTPYEHNRQGPRPQALYRFDLDREGSRLEDGLGWIAQKVGVAAGGTRIREGDEGPRAFFPVLLDDGRVLALQREGIELLDGDGRVLQRFADRAALDAALGAVQPLTSPQTWSSRPAQTLDEHLLDWRRRTTHLDLDPFLSEGAARRTRDGANSLPSHLPQDAALQEMGLSEEALGSHLVEALTAQAFSRTLTTDETRTIPYPSQDGSRIVLSRFDLAIETPHLGGRPGEYDRIHYCLDDELQDTFSTVLPVQVGQRHFALAASSDGRVSWLEAWHDPRRSDVLYRVEDQPWYETGTSIARMFTANDSVYALGKDGSVLAFQPPVPPGEHLVDDDLRADDGVTAAHPKEKRVFVSDTEVRIGGLTLPRRQS